MLDKKIVRDKKHYVLNLIGRLLRKGGSVVEEDHKEARHDVCMGCPKFGAVTVLGMEFEEGCTLCGCPIATKTRQDVLMRDPKNIGKAITPKELMLSPILGKKYVPEKSGCSNANENFKERGATGKDYWKEVDNKFFNKNNK